MMQSSQPRRLALYERYGLLNTIESSEPSDIKPSENLKSTSVAAYCSSGRCDPYQKSRAGRYLGNGDKVKSLKRCPHCNEQKLFFERLPLVEIEKLEAAKLKREEKEKLKKKKKKNE